MSHASARRGGKSAAYTYHELNEKDECNLFLSVAAYVGGLIGGIVLNMTPIYLPSVLRNAFLFKDTLYWKVLLVFIAVTALTNALCAIVRKGITRSYSGHGFVSGLIGSFLLGVGMALSQSDPLLLLVQLGTFTQSACCTAVGCLLAAITLCLTFDKFPRDKLKFKPQYLDGIKSGKIPYFVLAIPIGVACGAGAYFMETKAPFMHQGPKEFEANTIYSPHFVGAALSLVQFPLLLLFCKSIQGFCSWIGVISYPLNQLAMCTKSRRNGYVRFTGSLTSSWTILMGLGFYFGSLASGVFNLKNAFLSQEGASPLYSILGGFLMIFGALFAGGDAFSLCTGAANLHVPSVVNLLFMVTGAYSASTILGTGL